MNIRECSEFLKKNDRYLIVTHKNPDGDTLGSAAALCSALRRAGKTAHLFPNPGVTEKFRPFVQAFDAPQGYEGDCVLAVDIAAEGLFPADFERPVQLCIDHHPSNERYAAHLLLNAERASCGEIVLELIKALCGKVSRQEATLLYMAVSTDTGCFQYANTKPATFRAAAELLRLGAEHAEINMRFFRRASPARLRLEGMIYSSMGFYRDGKITVALVTSRMMAAAGVCEEDMDDIANLAGRAEDGVLSITIREQDDGTCRVSLRSSPEVNCSEICAVFGGGGHALAAGCTISGTPEKAREMILDVINEVWK